MLNGSYIWRKFFDKKSNVLIAGGDIASLNINDAFVDKIACHHAFEHFQGDKDIIFLKECYRILKTGGKVAIAPLFISENYIECRNIYHSDMFDSNAKLILDKSAFLPGADEDGHFARIYNEKSLINRILKFVNDTSFRYEIKEISIGKNKVANM